VIKDLYINMFDEEALFNHQEDASMTMWIDNKKALIYSALPI